MADRVTLRNPDTGEEFERARSAARFYVNQGYEVLDSQGRVSAPATNAAANPSKEK